MGNESGKAPGRGREGGGGHSEAAHKLSAPAGKSGVEHNESISTNAVNPVGAVGGFGILKSAVGRIGHQHTGPGLQVGRAEQFVVA